ncbi:MOSC domain-containing protein [Conexibacter arvalis]|uniref:MOSC domain-containing protein YiiM n=1 Tax=Conexibacter arvalis TaxID=912552 RepID=A0A840IBN7_9ACTN|nr:MOSC domain-containing protein [Conexibacter arvalis]MBB4662337.1 MOSC domain-containing protein YiiM [Conexibacter arvalis]
MAPICSPGDRSPAASHARGAAPLGTVLAVHAGRVAPLPWTGGRTIATAIAKRAVEGAARVGTLGIDGDEQGDRRNHGGPDQALCLFPSEHYDHFARLLGRPLERPAFGENLTTAGLSEAALCIGDRLRIGTVVAEVSMPRSPCYRVGARHGERRLPLWMEQSGFTGCYLRVVEPGTLRAGDAIALLDRPHPQATIAEANRVKNRDRTDLPAIGALLLPQLGERWRRRFERRLAGELEDPTARREGPPAG